MDTSSKNIMKPRFKNFKIHYVGQSWSKFANVKASSYSLSPSLPPFKNLDSYGIVLKQRSDSDI